MRRRLAGIGWAVLAFVTVLRPGVGHGRSSEDQEIAGIRELYSHVSGLVEARKPQLIELHSEAGADGYDVKRWHLAGEKQPYEHGAFEVMVFVLDREVIKTRIVVDSLSGDWADVVEYYYYRTGRPAFVFEGNTTYNGYVLEGGEKKAPSGPFVVEKRTYLSESGKQIRVLRKAYLRDSGKAVPLAQVQDVTFAVYGSVCSLPFISLIQDRVAPCPEMRR